VNLDSPKYNRAPNMHPNREMMALTMETLRVVEGDYFQYFYMMDLLTELLGRCFC